MAAHQGVVKTAALIKRRFYDARLVDAVRLPLEDMASYNSPGTVPSTSEYLWI